MQHDEIACLFNHTGARWDRQRVGGGGGRGGEEEGVFWVSRGVWGRKGGSENLKIGFLLHVWQHAGSILLFDPPEGVSKEFQNAAHPSVHMYVLIQ